MIEELACIREALLARIDDAELHEIEGWNGLVAFAERVVLDGVEIDSIDGAAEKWSARGAVSLALLNGDAERFGNVRLHMIASGNQIGTAASVDSLIISPDLH